MRLSPFAMGQGEAVFVAVDFSLHRTVLVTGHGVNSNLFYGNKKNFHSDTGNQKNLLL